MRSQAPRTAVSRFYIEQIEEFFFRCSCILAFLFVIPEGNLRLACSGKSYTCAKNALATHIILIPKLVILSGAKDLLLLLLVFRFVPSSHPLCKRDLRIDPLSCASKEQDWQPVASA
jgi:hypothetical protein